jgi:hypothetical protein
LYTAYRKKNADLEVVLNGMSDKCAIFYELSDRSLNLLE